MSKVLTENIFKQYTLTILLKQMQVLVQVKTPLECHELLLAVLKPSQNLFLIIKLKLQLFVRACISGTGASDCARFCNFTGMSDSVDE